MSVASKECFSRRLATPTSEGTNRLLWGDFQKGEYGVLVRVPDRFDHPDAMKQYAEKPFVKKNSLATSNFSYVPSSYLHASLRPSNALLSWFKEGGEAAAGFLAGSRYSVNWAMQQGQDMVHTPACYPGDAGSFRRNSLTKESHGMGCHLRAPQGGICLNGTCLYDIENNCVCNYKQVPGRDFGDFLSRWMASRGQRAHAPWNLLCSYETNLVGMTEMVAASNSLWTERRRWQDNNDSRYIGYTECPATENMKDKNMLDAIVIRLPSTNKHHASFSCDYPGNVHVAARNALMHMHGLGFHDLPVVFLEQARGMPNQNECDRMWNGTNCMDGYRKEIFAETFDFDDGSCLAIPKGCKDVYYFPVNNATGTCMISSDICKQAERSSPYVVGRSISLPGLGVSLSPLISVIVKFLPALTIMVGFLVWQASARKRSTSGLLSRKSCLMSLFLVLLPLLLIQAFFHGLSTSLITPNTFAADVLKEKHHVAPGVMEIASDATVSASANIATDATSLPGAVTNNIEQSFLEPPITWEEQQKWLCPARVPNLTATAITYRIAQRVFLEDERVTDVPREVIDRFFSHWPGHMMFRDRESGNTAVALRTYKCGSMTLLYYFKGQLGRLGAFGTSLDWEGFPKKQKGCIVTAYRDPVSHFISGLGEIEARREGTAILSYEKLPVPSEDRFLAFVEFCLRGGWRTLRAYLIGHVFPQSGYLVWLSSINRTVSSYVDLHNIGNEMRKALIDDCHLPESIPPIVTTKTHNKIDGLDDLLIGLWKNATSSPRILRAFEAICLMNAIDYACLAPQLQVPPPKVCSEAFQKYLPFDKKILTIPSDRKIF